MQMMRVQVRLALKIFIYRNSNSPDSLLMKQATEEPLVAAEFLLASFSKYFDQGFLIMKLHAIPIAGLSQLPRIHQ